ncbi:hypothetical protein ACFFQW_45210 [Umezawaea endophytica]|uniref:Uncharacterized protein n=1 Tax=Umezawaea endophytica TaxID=1654476 RepID=A0A9X3A6B5_9PSEU|nr:hypothetical protein [Umezawaea endophytica]MCS7484649.1 hypothetical protein [Umezawaea endophytica]
MPSLWIGPPGRLRAVDDAAQEFDRSVSLSVTEFQALGGAVTVTSLPTPPRRLALSWTGLQPGDAEWLDALARRVFGPSPLAVLDPSTRNLLDGTQSQGFGPVSSWELTGQGSLVQQPDRTVTLTGTSSTSVLRWQHPFWPGWPVPAGQRLTFTTSFPASTSEVQLYWFNAAGLSSWTSRAGATITAEPPDRTLFVKPAIVPGPLTTPIPVGPALLRLADPTPLPSPLPIGDGCPAMAVTGYTDRPTATARDLSLTLVEVRRARS